MTAQVKPSPFPVVPGQPRARSPSSLALAAFIILTRRRCETVCLRSFQKKKKNHRKRFGDAQYLKREATLPLPPLQQFGELHFPCIICAQRCKRTRAHHAAISPHKYLTSYLYLTQALHAGPLLLLPCRAADRASCPRAPSDAILHATPRAFPPTSMYEVNSECDWPRIVPLYPLSSSITRPPPLLDLHIPSFSLSTLKTPSNHPLPWWPSPSLCLPVSTVTRLSVPVP